MNQAFFSTDWLHDLKSKKDLKKNQNMKGISKFEQELIAKQNRIKKMENKAMEKFKSRQSVKLQMLQVDERECTLQALAAKRQELTAAIRELEKERDGKYLEQVSSLPAGKGFGELALKKERLMPRAATIQCCGRCHLAVMSKEDYKKVLQKIEARNLKKLIEFFKSIPFMSKNSKSALTKLNYSFEQRSFIRHQEIYKEGDTSDWVYLVKSGEFEITKKIKVQLKPTAKQSSAECKKFLKHKRGKKSFSSQPKIQIKPQTAGGNVGQRPAIRTFRVAIAGVGQLLGDEDVIKQVEDPERVYNCTVKCISKSAEVFRMKYDEFLRKFKPNKESWKIIMATAKQKERQMHQRYLYIIN